MGGIRDRVYSAMPLQDERVLCCEHLGYRSKFAANESASEMDLLKIYSQVALAAGAAYPWM